MLSNSLMCLRDQLSREIDAAIDGSEMALRVNQRSRSKIAALSHLDLRSGLITDKAHVSVGSILLKKSEYRLGPIFSAPWARFQMRTRGASSSASDSTERVLNRSAAVVSVNRRCRLYFGRFATTLDFRLFQQNWPIATNFT